MNTINNLTEFVSKENGEESFPEVKEMANHLNQKYKKDLMAIIFYGSALRSNTSKDFLLDFYVILKKLDPSIKNPLMRLFSYLLPPNVYYYELEKNGKICRAKVAIITMSAFKSGTSDKCFSPSLWGRFSQPIRLIYYNNEKTRKIVTEALSNAIKTFLANTIKSTEKKVSISELWVNGLNLTYGCELRPESQSKINSILENNRKRYEQVGKLALKELRIKRYGTIEIKCEKLKWVLRRYWTRSLNILRLVKAAYTFKGGIEYLVWKLERHRGIKIELTEKEKDKPILSTIKIFFKLKIWNSMS